MKPRAILPAAQLFPFAEGAAALERLVVDSLTSAHSRRAYARGLAGFFAWYGSAPRGAFTRALVQSYRCELQARGLAPSTINQQLAAIRKLAAEAANNELLDPAAAAAIERVRGVRQLGTRLGNWLTPEQAHKLLAAPDRTTLKGSRDFAVLALLVACGLRRSELTALTVEHIAERDGRPVILDLMGKGNRRRTVPLPVWVADAVREWKLAAAISSGRVFRSVRSGGTVARASLTEKAVWSTVDDYARKAGLGRIAPHDLRRTCAKLCRDAGGRLEQIQLLLGHASIQTTERYLGTALELHEAVNDRLGEVLGIQA